MKIPSISILKLTRQTPANALGKLSCTSSEGLSAVKVPVAGSTMDSVDEFIKTNESTILPWVQKLAPKLGLATKEQVAQAKEPVKTLLKSQLKSAKTALYNNGLQCGGAVAGLAGINWGIPLINSVFEAGIHLSPEFSLVARTVPISVFMNSFFRILENRRTMIAAEKNLAKLATAV